MIGVMASFNFRIIIATIQRPVRTSLQNVCACFMGSVEFEVMTELLRNVNPKLHKTRSYRRAFK